MRGSGFCYSVCKFANCVLQPRWVLGATSWHQQSLVAPPPVELVLLEMTNLSACKFYWLSSLLMMYGQRKPRSTLLEIRFKFLLPWLEIQSSIFCFRCDNKVVGANEYCDGYDPLEIAGIVILVVLCVVLLIILYLVIIRYRWCYRSYYHEDIDQYANLD